MYISVFQRRIPSKMKRCRQINACTSEQQCLFRSCSLLASLLLSTPAPENNPERAGDEDRGIAATGKTDEQCKGEVLRRVAAEIIQRKGRKEYRAHRIEGTRQRLEDTAVHQFVDIPAAAEMQLQILTDTVKDNDRIIDGITNDRQKRRNKGRIQLLLQQ